MGKPQKIGFFILKGVPVKMIKRTNKKEFEKDFESIRGDFTFSGSSDGQMIFRKELGDISEHQGISQTTKEIEIARKEDKGIAISLCQYTKNGNFSLVHDVLL